MSENQIVMFRAIDRPLTEKQLRFMDRQSTRGEFTQWGAEIEYQYGSFRGDVDGMLRNGYDIFLSYGNYGQREIRIRLPGGFPCAKSVWSKYVGREGLQWKPDKQGKAGILSVSPFIEGADENEFDFEDDFEATAELRAMLMAGDLRALYLSWLCTAMDANSDSDDLEPPVPHGMGAVSTDVSDLLGFFDVDPLMVRAASLGVPKTCPKSMLADGKQAWLSNLTEERRTGIIETLVAGDALALQAEILAEIRDCQVVAPWPSAPPRRTVAELVKESEGLREKEDEKEAKQAAAKANRAAAKAEKARQARMAQMKLSPEPWLLKASQLVEQRGHENYREAARLLGDLRETLGEAAGGKLVRKQAAQLVKKYPTLSVLKSALRKQGLLD